METSPLAVCLAKSVHLNFKVFVFMVYSTGRLQNQLNPLWTTAKGKQKLVAKPVWSPFSYFPSPVYSSLLQKSIDERQMSLRAGAKAAMTPKG